VSTGVGEDGRGGRSDPLLWSEHRSVKQKEQRAGSTKKEKFKKGEGQRGRPPTYHHACCYEIAWDLKKKKENWKIQRDCERRKTLAIYIRGPSCKH